MKKNIKRFIAGVVSLTITASCAMSAAPVFADTITSEPSVVAEIIESVPETDAQIVTAEGEDPFANLEDTPAD